MSLRRACAGIMERRDQATSPSRRCGGCPRGVVRPAAATIRADPDGTREDDGASLAVSSLLDCVGTLFFSILCGCFCRCLVGGHGTSKSGETCVCFGHDRRRRYDPGAHWANCSVDALFLDATMPRLRTSRLRFGPDGGTCPITPHIISLPRTPPIRD